MKEKYIRFEREYVKKFRISDDRLEYLIWTLADNYEEVIRQITRSHVPEDYLLNQLTEVIVSLMELEEARAELVRIRKLLLERSENSD